MVDIIMMGLVLCLVVDGAAVSPNVCSQNKIFKNHRRDFYSRNYPANFSGQILCRFHFNTSLVRHLKLHDAGFNITKLKMDIYYLRSSRWIPKIIYPRKPNVSLPESTAYDIYFHSPRIRFSFYVSNVQKPSNKVLKPCPESDKETTGNCEQQSALDMNDTASHHSNGCPDCLRENPAEPTAKSATIIVVSALIGSSFIMILIVGLMWKRHRMSKPGTVQRRQTDLHQRPDASSIYINPDTIAGCQLNQENEESHIYEKITTTSIYCDLQAAQKTSDKHVSGLYFEPQAALKAINSDDKDKSGLYCEPQTALKAINSDDKLMSGLYCEPQTLKNIDKENSNPIYVNIL